MRTREIVIVAVIVAAVLSAAFLLQQVRKGKAAKAKAAPVVVSEDEAATAVDISTADGRVTFEDCTLIFSTNPRRIVAFSITQFRARAEVSGKPLDIVHGTLSFAMETPMGKHLYALKPAKDGWYEAKAVLPASPRGGKLWFGTFSGTVAGRHRKAMFQFNLEPR